MSTATDTTTATTPTLEEMKNWTSAQFKEYQRKQNEDLKRVRELANSKKNDVKADLLKELEDVEAEFLGLMDVLAKVEVGENVEELSLHDALHGVPRTITVKARGKDEEAERKINAQWDKATRTAFRKAVANVSKILKAEPRRTVGAEEAKS